MGDAVGRVERRFRRSRVLCWTFRSTAGVFLILVGVCASYSQDETTVRRSITAVRFSVPPSIDGDLSDPCWAAAARATRFTDVLYGGAVTDQTVVLVGYDASNIYVGFHAYDAQPE